MKWSTGDKAICIRTTPWRDEQGNEIAGGPVKDVIYLVDAVVPQRKLVGLDIAGFAGLWDSDDFRRVVPRSESTEAVKEAVA